MRALTLRTRLMLLVSVAILPLALMTAFALTALIRQQTEQMEESTLSVTRAVATAVDTELRLTVSALETLAMAHPLASTDDAELASAYALAETVRASRQDWWGLSLNRPSGEEVFGTGSRANAIEADHSDAESLARVVQTGGPSVGQLRRGPNGRFGFAVRVPVMRNGKLRYVLSAIVSPDAILRVVTRQQVPDDWIVSIFDSDNARVARSRDHERYLGTPPSQSLQLLLTQSAGRPEAMGTTSTIEGDEVHAAVARIGWAGWTVALGSPTTAHAMGALGKSGVAYAAGLLLSLLVGGLAAWRVALSVTQPVARLRADAMALGRGQPVAGVQAALPEIDAVSDALVEAAALRSKSETERDALLIAERDALAAAEAARRRLQVLVGASSALSHSLEEASTLAAIAAVIVPDIADVCRIDLLDANGVLQRKLTHHADPARAALIDSMVRSGVVSADTPGSFPWAIATGETFLRNFESPDAVDVDDLVFRRFSQTVGMRATCVVPLVARGRTIGAMGALQAESGRRFAPEDGALIGELAQRAALALDNVRLFADSTGALKAAEEANLAKDEFLAMLGHELRNPLAPIVTALELMNRRDASAFVRERQIIGRQVKHLSRMVDDLLDVSRITSGKIELDMGCVDLRDVVGRAMESTLPMLQQRASLPRLSLPDEPVPVHGDSLRLTQVLCNLLINAAKFTPPDKEIVVEVALAAGQAHLAVQDEGRGIDAALLPHVFERFVQDQQALHRAHGGLGLGLAIARSLVELHGGTIHAESAGPDQGSRFVVMLPALRFDAAATAPDEPPPPRASAAMRLLIVDDNADAAGVLGLLLETEGHEVQAAGSAEEALELLRHCLPDAAMLDIGLPGMNGYNLARAIRADARLQSMILIALTGYGRDQDRAHAFDAGFDAHFAKPVDFEALVARLVELHDSRQPSS